MAGDLCSTLETALCKELDELHEGVRLIVATLPEEDLYRKPLDPGNSVGHLVLHLTGNLNWFVGANLGQSGYVRDREREFSDNDPPPKEVILGNLELAVRTFQRVVKGLSAETLCQPHPEPRLGNVTEALIHLVAHFSLHRGQMTYLARLLKQMRK